MFPHPLYYQLPDGRTDKVNYREASHLKNIYGNREKIGIYWCEGYKIFNLYNFVYHQVGCKMLGDIGWLFNALL